MIFGGWGREGVILMWCMCLGKWDLHGGGYCRCLGRRFDWKDSWGGLDLYDRSVLNHVCLSTNSIAVCLKLTTLNIW